ncbi:MAG: F0F1 ATP synthase subunit B [Ignavibacteria bacterium]|nr:F0F1 ATP synthase subunit B [Ignavibacteria bacterium]
MENLLNVSPGLIFWTLFNFSVFLFLIGKFGFKPLLASLKAREGGIQNAISEADRVNAEAHALLKESQAKLATAQQDMMALVKEGKQQAEHLIQAAHDEAERVKRTKMTEALREIEREKEAALLSLRAETAELIVEATSKILGNTLNAEGHRSLVENYISQTSKN